MRFKELVDLVTEKIGGRIAESSPDRCIIETDTGDERVQRVTLRLDGETLRYSTRCCEARDEFDDASFYRTLLEKNYELRHGYFAIAPDGGLEIVDNQLLETCDPEEIYISLTNLAALGDYVEKRLSGEDDF